MRKCMPSMLLKLSNSKIPHFKFYRFFRQSVIKLMGKTAINTILRKGDPIHLTRDLEV